MLRRFPTRWLLVVLSVLPSSCKPRNDVEQSEPVAVKADPALLPAVETRPEEVDLISELGRCELRDDGIVLDLGFDGTDWRRGFSLGPFEDIRSVERGGESFGQFMVPSAKFAVWLTEAQSDLRVETRAYGVGAKNLAIQLDGKRLGVLRLEKGVSKVLSLAIPSELKVGLHSLEVRFLGGRREPGEAYGELDWIRVRAKDAPASYPPTFGDVVSEVALSGVPHRVLALKSQQAVRCPVSLSGSATLRVSAGFWGKGGGKAVVRLLLDGEPPQVLLERQVNGGNGASYAPLKVTLDQKTSGVGLLELGATFAEDGRVVFGDPIIAEEPKAVVPRTNLVVVFVASSIAREDVPPWGTGESAGLLREFSNAAVAFPNYRVPSHVPAAVLASLFSGLSPGVHGVVDSGSRLMPKIQTLARALKAAGGRAAFVSAVPTTFGAFGFGRDWDEYFTASPVLDLPATEVLSRAIAWLESESLEVQKRPHLLVIYTRGTHPPWDITRVEAQRLGPKEYAGTIDARRGGIVIGDLRRRGRKLKDEDWERTLALQKKAFSAELQVTKKLLGVLKKHDLFDSSMLVYMGDVGSARRPALPFEPDGELSEARLSVPLLVKFPGARSVSAENNSLVTTRDIAVTIAGALGLGALPHATGLDLYSIVHGYAPPKGRALLATRADAYLTRAGVWQLAGRFGKVPHLCRLDSDPACTEDLFSTASYAARATWIQTFDTLLAEKKLFQILRGDDKPEAWALDPETRAALTVWGDIP